MAWTPAMKRYNWRVLWLSLLYAALLIGVVYAFKRQLISGPFAYVAAVAGKRVAGGKTATSGKDIFAANCGSCHTLKAAGTSGTVGPNLDQLKLPEARVKTQVINGGGGMPAFKGTLTDAQISAVAKYVAEQARRRR